MATKKKNKQSPRTPRTEKAFHFFECSPMPLLTGKKASNLKEFLNILKDIEGSVIYHHLHQAYLQPSFELWDYPNDFAHWAAEALEDKALAENLSNFDPYDFPDIEELRAKLVDIIEAHIWDITHVPWARPGSEFHFCDSVIIVYPTNIKAIDLAQFVEGLKMVNDSSVFYHFYEARRRLKQDIDDFSLWLEKELGHKKLAEKIRKIDFYLHSLKNLKRELLELCRRQLERTNQ